MTPVPRVLLFVSLAGPAPSGSAGTSRLCQGLHAEQVTLYGFADDPDDPDDTPNTDYDPPHGLFLVAYQERSEEPVGCGGWRRIGTDIGEIKRMYVVPELRGHALGRRILQNLEEAARSAGITRMRLETGRDNHRALRLYTASGYQHTEPYSPDRNPVINRALSKHLTSGYRLPSVTEH